MGGKFLILRIRINFRRFLEPSAAGLLPPRIPLPLGRIFIRPAVRHMLGLLSHPHPVRQVFIFGMSAERAPGNQCALEHHPQEQSEDEQLEQRFPGFGSEEGAYVATTSHSPPRFGCLTQRLPVCGYEFPNPVCKSDPIEPRALPSFPVVAGCRQVCLPPSSQRSTPTTWRSFRRKPEPRARTSAPGPRPAPG